MAGVRNGPRSPGHRAGVRNGPQPPRPKPIAPTEPNTADRTQTVARKKSRGPRSPHEGAFLENEPNLPRVAGDQAVPDPMGQPLRRRCTATWPPRSEIGWESLPGCHPSVCGLPGQNAPGVPASEDRGILPRPPCSQCKSGSDSRPVPQCRNRLTHPPSRFWNLKFIESGIERGRGCAMVRGAPPDSRFRIRDSRMTEGLSFSASESEIHRIWNRKGQGVRDGARRTTGFEIPDSRFQNDGRPFLLGFGI